MEFCIKKGKAWLSDSYSESSSFNNSASVQLKFSDSYELKHLTKSQSRRMSRFSKMTVDLSLDIATGEQIHQAVFASRHGELGNSTDLIDLIIDKELLSPTKFTQSVHNTPSGLFSIISENLSLIHI